MIVGYENRVKLCVSQTLFGALGPASPRGSLFFLRRAIRLWPSPQLSDGRVSVHQKLRATPWRLYSPLFLDDIGALTNRPAALGVETECCVGLGDALTSVLSLAPQSLFRTRASGQPRPTLPNYPAGRCWRLGAL